MIGITWTETDPQLKIRAKSLGAELGLTLFDRLSIDKLSIDNLSANVNSKEVNYFLNFTPEHLELMTFDEKGRKHALLADFIKGSFGYRRQHGGGIKQLIGRAVGIKTRQTAPTVLDGTAGLGKDGFILASLGCSVTLIERSPIIAALLKDGLSRAAAFQETSEIIKNKIKIFVTDLQEYLENLPSEQYPDVIYLDPMFPERKKSALTKMEMRIIRDIVGYNEDTEQLLNATLSIAKKRVVVKRPLYAAALLWPVAKTATMSTSQGGMTLIHE
jgi:16S rRNA (guanine1516-N2)-methyltransferase